ncbi:zinc finger protein CONSTANS-LIKE 1-like [Iris pallida]|uniref:Zinc finger protein CONSTANS-LIKE 1-like n=1 Tax=Iris pallida TaxID=29817 RepID=A0AAX6I7N4_IRIPA|nr:zinc finger protein CONSTANS-LIKE 1-like [Iris pallida]
MASPCFLLVQALRRKQERDEEFRHAWGPYPDYFFHNDEALVFGGSLSTIKPNFST